MNCVIFLKSDIQRVSKTYGIDLYNLATQADLLPVIIEKIGDPISGVPVALYRHFQGNVDIYEKICSFYGISTNIICTQLLHKDRSVRLVQEAGLPVLPQTNITSIESIQNFSHDKVIIKPRIGTFSQSVIPYAYKILTKSELLEIVDIDKVAGNFIIQKAIDNNHPILWVTGYANINGIFIDGILNQYFSIDDRHTTDKTSYPAKHIMTQTETKDNFDIFQQQLIDQVTTLFSHHRLKYTPFCIQGIRDDDGTVYLMDFNVGMAKHYSMACEKNNPQFFIDRFKYMWGKDEEFKLEKDTHYHTSAFFNLPEGVSDQFKTFCDSNDIILDGVTITSMIRQLEVKQANLMTTGNTHQEAWDKLMLASQFGTMISRAP